MTTSPKSAAATAGARNRPAKASLAAVQSVSREGLMELIGHEGIVQTRYKDSVGVWTIGVGHTKSAGPPNPVAFLGTMTIAEVYDLFRRDIAKYEADVRSVLTVAVSQTEFDALVSFHFNTGGIRRASLVQSLNAGDRQSAAAQFMNWSRPAEIIPRRKKEQKLFAQGHYSGGGKATVYPADADGKVKWNQGRIIDLASVLDRRAANTLETPAAAARPRTAARKDAARRASRSKLP
ncbi:lysozyme [Phreatobacter stygius]|nr:lysozyme [Phreatobacter stygius]